MCATALGHLAVGEPSFPHKASILEALFSTKETKHVDLHFSVGEALSCVAAGQACDLAVSPWDCVRPDAEVAMEVATDDNAMESTLQTILDEYAFSPASLVRQVSNPRRLYC